MNSQAAQLNNMAYDENSGLLLLGNVNGSTLSVLHLSSSLDSFDSVAKFEVVVPIISLEAVPPPADSLDADVLQVHSRYTATFPHLWL